MKIRFSTIYALLCTLLLVTGLLLIFYFSWSEGVHQTVAALIGCVLSFLIVPFVHELGHLIFGVAAGMECVYWKAFCFKFSREQGKRRFSFASPFSVDQTQMLPKKGGNMRARASWYTLGGLLVSLLLLAVALLSAVLADNFVAWGMLPYTGYMLLFNLAPLAYASGKTDTLVFMGLRRGNDAERCMLAAMEIQGQLYEGKSFSEIEESLYFNLPQLCEEEPLYAILLDLRYRYYLDIEDIQRAADCLNRLAQAQAYLSDEEVQRIAAELVYMHARHGNLEGAEESGKLCKEYLTGNTPSAKRCLAAYSLAAGKREEAAILKSQGMDALAYERITGVKKWEEKLLSRIKTE